MRALGDHRLPLSKLLVTLTRLAYPSAFREV
jgi:hypothetical protein